MLTTSCPQCEKEVTLPLSAGPESQVRCPLCSHEYSLESVFAELPPLLELLNAEPAAEATMAAAAAPAAESAGMFDLGGGGDSSSDEAEGGFALADAEEHPSTASSFDFGADAAVDRPRGANAGAAPTSRPRRRKQANPVMEIVKVVLGGVVALPIAQLILWWLPGDWKRDPVGLAPSLPSFVSFLAPESLRNPDGDTDDAATADGQPPGPAKGRPPEDALANLGAAGGGEFGRNDLNAALLGNGAAGSNPKPDDRPRGRNKPKEEGGGGLQLDDPTEPGDSGSGGGGEPDIGFPGIDEPLPPDSDPAPAEKLGPADAPTYDRTKLGDELAEIKNSLGLIDLVFSPDPEIERDDRIAAGNAFVSDMAGFAHVVTYTDPIPAGYDEHFNAMLAAAGDSEPKRSAISKLGEKRIADAQRKWRRRADQRHSHRCRAARQADGNDD